MTLKVYPTQTGDALFEYELACFLTTLDKSWPAPEIPKAQKSESPEHLSTENHSIKIDKLFQAKPEIYRNIA